MSGKIMRFVICLVLLLSTIACAPLSPQTDTYFTLVALPDTQHYSEEYPDIFESQTTWIKEHTKDWNIVFTIHLGDLVNVYDNEGQWDNARRAMNILTGLPYSVLPGNHDNNYGKDNTYFNHYFNFTEFSGFKSATIIGNRPGYSWYSGHFPTSGNENSSETFKFAGTEYMIINIGYGAQTESLKWAENVVSANPKKQIILATHSYLDVDGNRTPEGSILWDEIVRKYPNIFMVLCGHKHGEAVSTQYGDQGNRIYEIVSDYQDDEKGGNGYLRLYEFHPARQIIKVSTYSPYLDKYKLTADSQFELSTGLK